MRTFKAAEPSTLTYLWTVCHSMLPAMSLEQSPFFASHDMLVHITVKAQTGDPRGQHLQGSVAIASGKVSDRMCQTSTKLYKNYTPL